MNNFKLSLAAFRKSPLFRNSTVIRPNEQSALPAGKHIQLSTTYTTVCFEIQIWLAINFWNQNYFARTAARLFLFPYSRGFGIVQCVYHCRYVKGMCRFQWSSIDFNRLLTVAKFAHQFFRLIDSGRLERHTKMTKLQFSSKLLLLFSET